MKPNLLLSVIAILLLTPSCYVIKYTHQEVMDEIIGQTKEEVIASVGIGDERRTEGRYEEWIYYGDEKTFTYNRPSNSNTTVQVNPYSNSARVNTHNYGSSSVTRNVTGYIKVTFYDGVVTKWESRGVDLSEKEYKPGRSLIAFVATIGAIALTIALASITP